MIPKFRAWEQDTKFMNGQVRVTSNRFGDGEILVEATDGFGWVEVKPEYLMQSTSLKDKNGVEIYEGDVVKMDRPPVNEKSLFLVKDYVLGKVIFAEVNEFGKDSWSFNGGYTGYSLEVIGNIYENPELLEEE